eukprot:g964.t1
MSRVEGTKLTGSVKWFNFQKGYGFLIPDDGGPDVFLHQTEIQTHGKYRALCAGWKIEGIFGKNQEGKPSLTKIMGLGGTTLPAFESQHEAIVQDKAIRDGLASGTIKWYNAAKDYGFIVPDEQGASDIYFSPQHLNLPRAPIPNERCHFSVKMDKNGRTVAAELRLAAQVETPAILPQQQAQAHGYGYGAAATPAAAAYGSEHAAAAAAQQAYGQPAQNGGAAAAAAASGYGAMGGYAGYPGYAPVPTIQGREVGAIKFYNEAKGFGFIMPTFGGADVHFKGDQFEGEANATTLVSGMQVTFMRKVKDSKQWAEKVRLTTAKPGATPGGSTLGKRKFQPKTLQCGLMNGVLDVGCFNKSYLGPARSFDVPPPTLH